LKTLFLEARIGGSLETLDDASPYFDLGPRQITSAGVYHYMSTRNNNFSNRDQKGEIVIYENDIYNAYIGLNGGWIDFDSGEVYIPAGAFDALENFRVQVKTKDQVANTDLDTKVLIPNNFDQNSMASNLIIFDQLQSEIKKPLNVILRLKRGVGAMESYTLYRINNELLTKIDSKLDQSTLKFDTQQTGIYVVKYEKNYGVLIGVLVTIGLLLILVGAAIIFFYKNPQFAKSIRYRATNVKRSMNNQL
jgi:hypothetical protein